MGRKRTHSSDSDGSASEGRARGGRFKFEEMDESELENVTVPPNYPPPPPPLFDPSYEMMQSTLSPPPPQSFPPAMESAVPNCTPPLPDVPVNIQRELPKPEDFVPIAAVTASDAKPEDEAVEGLLREPQPPTEVVMVTKPGVHVPMLPVDLMTLLLNSVDTTEVAAG
eukprot:gene5061-3648_t